MLLFMDSFEHTTATGKWTTQRGGAPATLDLIAGRYGNGWNMNARYLTKGLGANYTQLIHGFAFKPSSAQSDYLASFLYDASSRSFAQCSLWYDAAQGQFRIYRGVTTSLLGSVFASIPIGGFGYIEWKATFNASTGSVVLRLNGQTILTLTNVNTSISGTTVNGFLQGSANDGSWAGAVHDDVYVLDNTDSGISGCPNNDFWGDTRIECRYPDGNGNSSQLTGSDGNSTDNYLLVDEATPNDDTDYVESSTVGNKDTYTYQNLASTSGSVFGVGIYPYAKKTDAGSRSIKSIARLSGTEVDGPERTLSSGYGYLYDYRDGDPSGAQWTRTNVDAAEFGVKVFA